MDKGDSVTKHCRQNKCERRTMQWSEEKTMPTSPISIMEDKLSNILQNATVDMSDVSPVNNDKKVRFKDDNEVCWITSPNANTEYSICEQSGKKCLSIIDETSVACISVEEILNANREYVRMKIKSGKEVVITKVIGYVCGLAYFRFLDMCVVGLFQILFILLSEMILCYLLLCLGVKFIQH